MQYAPRAGMNTWGTTANESKADRALAYANASADEIRMMPPPLPQVILFRDRLGLPTYAERQTRISDLVDIPRDASDPARIDWTGTDGSYSGSSRNSTIGGIY